MRLRRFVWPMAMVLWFAALAAAGFGLFQYHTNALLPSSLHHVIATSGFTPIGEIDWTYSRAEVHWAPTVLDPNGDYYRKDGARECFRFAAITADPVFMGYILDHGSDHEVCFWDLNRDGFKGPVAPRR